MSTGNGMGIVNVQELYRGIKRRAEKVKSVCIHLLVTAVLASAAVAHDAGNLEASVNDDGWKSVEIEDMELSWTHSQDTFIFRVTAPTEGWVSVGFQGGPAMKDAAIYIGYAEGSEGYFRDDHGTSPISHQPDTQLGGSDGIIEASAWESEGYTSLEITVAAEPSDELDYLLAEGSEVRIILAYGSSDSFSGMHSEAHTAEVEL